MYANVLFLPVNLKNGTVLYFFWLKYQMYQNVLYNQKLIMNEMKLLAQEMQGFLFVLPPKALKWRFLFNKVKRARNVKSPRNFFTGFLILELSRAKSPGIFYPGKKKILEFFLKNIFQIPGKTMEFLEVFGPRIFLSSMSCLEIFCSGILFPVKILAFLGLCPK